MSINYYFLLSAYPDGLPEEAIGNIALKARSIIGDVAVANIHWGNYDRKRRVLTVPCEIPNDEKLAIQISTMLQERNLDGVRKSRALNFEANHQKSGAGIKLERL